MIFSSSIFLLYFLPVFLVIYFLADQKYKNFVALVASLLFYSWGGSKFIFVILISLLLDFYIVKMMDLSANKKKKMLLVCSVFLNLGLLVYFKYSNFFVYNLNQVLIMIRIGEIPWKEIALPIGISFFTFQKLSYSIDIYRKVHAPMKKITDYMLYILLFPHAIAGPIIRYNEIADQIEERASSDTIDNKLLGFYRFIIGLSKKVLIANVLGAQADKIFLIEPNNLSTNLAWIGITAYTFQLYFDFSGYSDMAIGLGRMMGFVIPENFNFPYISKNITEFWKRWHITLGKWFRDYVYIPLGGNRASGSRIYFNLWVVFLISGLWHGSGWTFIFWGAYHGFFLIADRLFLIKLLEKIGKYPAMFITFIIVVVGWVFFRSATFQQAILYLKKMFSFHFSSLEGMIEYKFWWILILAIIFSLWGNFKAILNLEQSFYSHLSGKFAVTITTLVAVFFFMLCVSEINSSDFNPFIYFRF